MRRLNQVAFLVLALAFSVFAFADIAGTQPSSPWFRWATDSTNYFGVWFGPLAVGLFALSSFSMSRIMGLKKTVGLYVVPAVFLDRVLLILYGASKVGAQHAMNLLNQTLQGNLQGSYCAPFSVCGFYFSNWHVLAIAGWLLATITGLKSELPRPVSFCLMVLGFSVSLVALFHSGDMIGRTQL